MDEGMKCKLENGDEMPYDNEGCTLPPLCTRQRSVGTEAWFCRHTSESLPFFMHAPYLILTSTTLSPLPSALSRWLYNLCNHVLFLRWKINYNSFTSKGSGMPTADRLDDCVCILVQRMQTVDRLIHFIWRIGVNLLFRQLKWCLMAVCCFADTLLERFVYQKAKRNTDISPIFYWRECQRRYTSFTLGLWSRTEDFYGFISAASLNRLN